MVLNGYVTQPAIPEGTAVTVLKVSDFSRACHQCHAAYHVHRYRCDIIYPSLPCVCFMYLIACHCGQAQLLATIKRTSLYTNARTAPEL